MSLHLPRATLLLLLALPALAKEQTRPAAGADAFDPIRDTAAKHEGATRVVDRHLAVFDKPPRNVPTRMMVDGPLLGNGDLGIVLAGPPERQTFYIGKNDFWTRTHENAKIMTVGSVTLEMPDLRGATYRQEQDLAHAEVRGTFTRNGLKLDTRTWVDANANVLVTELTCSGRPTTVSVRQAIGQTPVDTMTVPKKLMNVGKLNIGREQHAGGRWYFNGEIAGVSVTKAIHDGKPTPRTGAPKSFDGKTTWMKSPAASAETAVSVSAWVKIASASGANYIASTGAWDQGYSLGLSAGRLRWSINGVAIETEKPLPLGRWIHLAATYDGKEMRLYMNGVLKASRGSSGADPLLFFTRKADALPGRGREVAVATCIPGAKGTTVTLQPGVPTFVATAILSDMDRRDFPKAAKRLVAEATPETLAKSEILHRRWWDAFWARSFIEIPDKEIEKRWYAAVYAMGCCSRPGKTAPGLWGNWITTDNPLFNGDYHLNYNAQAPFFLTYGTNHPELSLPFFQVINDATPNGRKFAKMRGWKGIHFSLAHGPWGLLAYGLTQDFGQRSDAVLAAQNFIWYWRHTRDDDWLRKDAYPYLSGVAEFWVDYLKFENGRYVIHNDAIQELSGDNLNPLLSLALVRSLFTTMIEASERLGVDAQKRPKWRHILDHLSAYPLQTRNGKTVFRYSERGTDWWHSNTLGIQHIFPAGAIGLDSDPKMLAIARNTAQELARWHDNNGFWSWYSACARIGIDPDLLLTKLRKECDINSYPNLLIHHGGGGIENCTGLLAVNEMLLQSHEGVLRFFPCWPKDKDARFGTLRACGAFLVSAQLKDGAISGVVVTSEKGRDCAVANPWPGKKVVVTRNGKAAETVEGERFVLKTTAGKTLELAPD